MEKHCDNEECKNYWSCKMLNDRFHTVAKGCGKGRAYNPFIVDVLHQEEIEKREEILKKVNR